MAWILSFAFFMVSSYSMAAPSIHKGIYQVQDSLGNPVDFHSELSFEGSDLNQAEELTMTFPKTLVGETNKIVLKKLDGKWEGEKNLFDHLHCSTNKSFDFSCLLIFNPDQLEDTKLINEEPKALPFGMVETFAALPTPTSEFVTLRVNRDKAEQALQLEGFNGLDLERRLDAVDEFFSEPIGWIRYRKSGVY